MVWAYRNLAAAMRQAAVDERLTDRERRAELRSLGKAIAALVPRARLRRAELVVREQRQRMNVAVDPPMEPAPPDDEIDDVHDATTHRIRTDDDTRPRRGARKD
jgi:hypothetical protein